MRGLEVALAVLVIALHFILRWLLTERAAVYSTLSRVFWILGYSFAIINVVRSDWR